MQSKNPFIQAFEPVHEGNVRSLGCIVCSLKDKTYQPAVLHHIRYYTGMGRKEDAWHTLPLCPLHHTIGSRGTAFHAGRQSWEAQHGTQADLLDEVYRRLGYPPPWKWEG